MWWWTFSLGNTFNPWGISAFGQSQKMITAMSCPMDPGYGESSQRERASMAFTATELVFVYVEGISSLWRWNPEQWNTNLRMSMNLRFSEMVGEGE